MNVKQESQDEAEIREMAAKFSEAHRSRISPQRVAQQPGQGEAEVKNVDEESILGRFGWTTMGKIHIPFIMRSGEYYCSVRIVEMKVLNKLLTYLHQDLYNCTNIRSYYITEAEAKLFNEINFKHCDYQYGREAFTQRDLIVRLIDANEFYHFLGHCYAKLMNTVDSDSLGRCGFIRINRESVVPYTVYNDQKYVPLFYFEGETENLKQRADKLEGWDLSYLKFCCKVQGIRNELFAHDSCSVISLNDIKNYFPPGTLFEDYWPKKNLDSQLLLSRSSNPPQIIQWTRQPVAPPLSVHSTSSPKPVVPGRSPTPNNSHAHNIPNAYSNYNLPAQSIYHTANNQPRVVNSAAPRTTAYAAAAAAAATPAPNRMRPYFTPAPPPLVRTSTMMAQYNAQQKASSGNYSMILEPGMNQNSFHQQSYPPPLLHMNGGISRYDGSQSRYRSEPVDIPSQNRSSLEYLEQPEIFGTPSTSKGVGENGLHQNFEEESSDGTSSGDFYQDMQNTYANVNNTPMVNQQPHQVPRTQSNTANEERNNVTNGRSTLLSGMNNRHKLIPLPEAPPTSTTTIPYKIQKALVEGKMIPCINMKPNSWNDLLVSLPDLVTSFFNNVPVQSCQQVMQVLGIEIYKANMSQVRLLTEGRCSSGNETIPLVQVRNVIDYMPQLKYMLNGILTTEVASKRQRNS